MLLSHVLLQSLTEDSVKLEKVNETCADQLGVSPLVQDDVLRLQVSVDDSSAVQEGQSLDHAAGVEPSHAVIKRSSETHSELTLRKSWT